MRIPGSSGRIQITIWGRFWSINTYYNIADIHTSFMINFTKG